MRRSRVFRKALLTLLLLVSSASSQAQETLDVLVVYGQKLRAYYNDRDGIEAMLASNFFSANESFQNSGVDLRVRMIAFRELDYVEDDWSMSQTLDHLAKRDGRIDEALDWREHYGADLVYFFRANRDGNRIGTAFLLRDPTGDSDTGFGVVSATLSLSELVLQHEIGHNLGCAHDRENASSSGMYEDSYGYRFWDKSLENTPTYRTVMAYEPGTLVNLFSSPDLFHDGLAAGVANGPDAANNARTLSAAKEAVSKYRNISIGLPPEAYAGRDQVAETRPGEEVATVTLAGRYWWSASETVYWEWSWNGGSAVGQNADAAFEVGTHLVTLRITDTYGNSATDTMVVDVLPWSEIQEVVRIDDRTFIIKESGITFAAGSSELGALGTGSALPSPEFVPLPLLGVEQVASTYETTLFVTKDGALYGAGRVAKSYEDYYWNLTESVPVELVDSGVVQAAVGSDLALYLTEDGALWGWGYNNGSFLGDAEDGVWHEEVNVMEGGVSSVRIDSSSALVRMDDGSWWATGAILQYFDTSGRPTVSTYVKLFGPDVAKVDFSYNHVVALHSDGRVVGYGERYAWGLGRANGSDRLAPVELVAHGALDVWVSAESTVVKLGDGSIWGVGKDLHGMNGRIVDGIREMTQLFGSRVSDLRIDQWTWVLRRNDGSYWAVGANAYGSLGLGEGIERLDTVEPMPWGPPPSDLGNEAPQAALSGRTSKYDTDGDGFSSFRIDARASTDDWAIDRYEWTFEGQTVEGAILDAAFPLGSTAVTFRVYDSDDAYDEVKLVVTVKQSDAGLVDVEVTHENVLALRNDGSLWGLGPNGSGVLGERLADENPDEWTVVFESGVKDFAVGFEHAVALMDDGSLWVSGRNHWGQLGLGSTDPSFGFVEIVEEGVVAVAAAHAYSLFLKDDGTVWGMGNNQYQQLGKSGPMSFNSPTQLAVDGTVVAIHASISESFLRLEDGRLLVSRRPNYGEGFKEIAAAGVEAFAVNSRNKAYFSDESGAVYSIGFWNGDNDFKWEANGSPVLSHPLANVGADQLVVSGDFVLSRTKEGAVIGLETEELRGEAYGLPDGIEDVIFGSGVVDVATGHRYTAFAMEDGSIWLLGNNGSVYSPDSGSLVDSEDRGFPIEILAPSSPRTDEVPVASAGDTVSVVTITGEDHASLRLTSEASYDDRFIRSWSWNWNGEVIEGITLEADFPVGINEVVLSVQDNAGNQTSQNVVVIVEGVFEISRVRSSENWSLLILKDGSVYGSSGSAGEAFGLDRRRSHFGVRLPLSNISEASVSNTHALLLDKEGGVWFFGYNDWGQAGQGFAGSLETPFKIVEEGVAAVSAGYGTSLILMTDGSVWAAGLNYFGQLGLGHQESQLTFSEVEESGVISIGAGWNISAFVKDDGSLWQMGYDVFSDGWGDAPRFVSPEKVIDAGVASVSVGKQCIYIVLSDGTLRGAMTAGETLRPSGEGIDRWIELLDFRIQEVVASNRDAYAIAEDGSLWMVGEAESYYNPERLFTAPRRLLFSGVESVATAENGALALRSDGLVFGSGQSYRFHFGQYPNSYSEWGKLAGKSKGWVDQMPVAMTDKQSGAFPYEEGEAFVIDGQDSIDDWQISSWSWKVNGHHASSDPRLWLDPMESLNFIELTVSDENGNEATTNLRIRLYEGEEYASWLRQYFSEQAVLAMDDPLLDDSDEDGFSNFIESRLGTSPLDSSERPRFRLEPNGDTALLSVSDVEPGSRILISTSSNLKEWHMVGEVYVADENGKSTLTLERPNPSVFFRFE